MKKETGTLAQVWPCIAMIGGCWLASLSLPMGALAQVPVDSVRGLRIRVTLWDPPLNTEQIGILKSSTRDSLELWNPDGTWHAISADRLVKVEVSDGGNSARGALTGLGVGAAVGFIGLRLWANHFWEPDDANFYVPLFFGAPLGGLIGAIIGSERTKERWLPVAVGVGRLGLERVQSGSVLTTVTVSWTR